MHGLASLTCCACSSGEIFAFSENANQECTMCGGTCGDFTLAQCTSCSVVYCASCAELNAMLSSDQFCCAFPEVAHCFPLGQPQRVLSYIDILTAICMSNSSGMAPFYLKPPLPSGLCRYGLHYDAADYFFENYSEVYGLTFSQKAQVESLNCPLKRDDCKIQCAGRDSRAGVYRHSSRYAYKTEVFDFFGRH